MSDERATDQQVSQAIRIGIAATQKGDHASALKVFKAVYENPAIEASPDGLSSYGLSLAVAEKQTGRGVQLCRDAIAAQFFEERHYENLIRLHLHAGNRKNAEQTLGEGLKNVTGSSKLQSIQKEMGLAPARVKSRPTGGGGRQFDLKALPPAVTAFAGLLFFVLVFGVTFWITYRQVYGP